MLITFSIIHIIFFYLTIQLTATTSTDQPLVLLTTDSLKNNREHGELFNNLVAEYDRRLEEQVKLAKDDMLHELEFQIQVSVHNAPRTPNTIAIEWVG